MFWNKNKNKSESKSKSIIPSTCKFELFNKEYTLEIVVDECVADEEFITLYDQFLNMSEQIQDAIEKYVKNNYFDLIEDCYVNVTGGCTADSLKIKQDFEKKEKNAIDIVLKYIQPVSYEVVSSDESYLFIYISDSDGHGMDVTIPDLQVRDHE